MWVLRPISQTGDGRACSRRLASAVVWGIVPSGSGDRSKMTAQAVPQGAKKGQERSSRIVSASSVPAAAEISTYSVALRTPVGAGAFIASS
jgi:hypothetical protein